MSASNAKSSTKAPKAGPKGTRDFYPDDLLRHRYITEHWRATSIRHGFEEINGPTFELADLYAVKSGEGILGELFQAFSGKAPEEREQVMREGNAPYALRPEFTPTLARMYAARAASLPNPCKWFCIQPFFRAERPQRGRLREFWQWNCDVIGGENAADRRSEQDVELMSCNALALQGLGLTQRFCKIVVGHRNAIQYLSPISDASQARAEQWLGLIDVRQKMTRDEFLNHAISKGFNEGDVLEFDRTLSRLDGLAPEQVVPQITEFITLKMAPSVERTAGSIMAEIGKELEALHFYAQQKLSSGWFKFDLNIVRGLAYYTGTVFEVIAEGERAVAGGGRYDNLIELFGGPPTPAVGFGMGDVVLTNLLDDRKLMPEGQELRAAIDRTVRTTSLRPQAFVVASGEEKAEAHVTPLLANLRRGVERDGFVDELAEQRARPWDADRYRVPPLHARTTAKSTRNKKKLLQDAGRQHARFYVEINQAENEDLPKVSLKDLDDGRDFTPDDIGESDRYEFSLNPADPHYVGRAIAMLG